MNNRIVGYDFIRSFAIIIVFLGHILSKQSTNEVVLLICRSLSPGLTMSLLGFISAVLLSVQNDDFGTFIIRRITRIYIPLIACLSFVLCTHALLGKQVVNQHMLLHLMGLSAFFELFQVQNKATIGGGLWFITVIFLMYLALPLLQKLFQHSRRQLHLLILIILCTTLNFIMYGTMSSWNVIISFSVGAYLGVNGQIDQLLRDKTARSFFYATGLLIVVTLSTAGVFPYSIRGLLFAFYPIAFVPLLFAITQKLPTAIVAASSFFAGLSYEFYILHFYFINDGFQELFPIKVGLWSQMGISFVVTLSSAYVLSRIAAVLRRMTDKYMLMNTCILELSKSK